MNIHTLFAMKMSRYNDHALRYPAGLTDFINILEFADII